MYFMMRRRMSDLAKKKADIEKAQQAEAKSKPRKSQGSFEDRSENEECEDDRENTHCSLSRTGTMPLSRATIHNTREVECTLHTQIDVRTKFDSKDCTITGISFSRGGDLLVSDANNKKVKMFDLKGNLRIEFTILQSYGALKYPVGVCGLNSGEVVVADKDGSDLKVFAPEGRFMMSFGKGLQGPTIMTSTVSKQVILLEEATKEVYVYNAMTEDHACLHNEDKKHHKFKSPSGIAVISDKIFVADENKLLLFDDHGRYSSTYSTDTGSSFGRGVGTGSSVDVTLDHPVSMAADRDHNVLVLQKTNVLSFSTTKHSFIRLLDLTNTPVKNPAGVATSQNGFMAIYTEEGSTVYIYKYFEKL